MKPPVVNASIAESVYGRLIANGARRTARPADAA